MIFLFTSAALELYQQFVLQVLCYPEGFILSEVPYTSGRVPKSIFDDPESLIGDDALITFVDYFAGANDLPIPEYIPLRSAEIANSRVYGDKLLLSLRLRAFIYYSPAVVKLYDVGRVKATRSEQLDAAPAYWNSQIGGVREAPHPVRKKPAIPEQFGNSATWQSGGKFVCSGDVDLALEA